MSTETCSLENCTSHGSYEHALGRASRPILEGAKEIDNVSMLRSAFTNKALHCDFNPKITNANARKRRNGTPMKPVPYSVIINCSHANAIIRGAGLSCMEAIGIDESTGEDHHFN